jgi:F1F0 ATPase subunit 2
MNAYLQYLAVILVGALLGGFFFVGLWWTVNRVPRAKHPVVLFLASGVVRTAVVMSGFWFVGRGNAIAMMCCLVGFISARLVLTRGIPGIASLDKRPAR